MSEMVDRVARAIYEGSGARAKQVLFGRPVKSWEEVVAGIERGEILPFALNPFRDLARHYLAFVREPTEAMLQAGEAAIFEHRAQSEPWQIAAAKDGWYAMIDKALE